MDNGDFRRILDRYLKGRATAEEQGVIDKWYENMGKRRGSFLSNKEEVKLETWYWSRLRKILHPVGADRRKQGARWAFVGIAASVLLLASSHFVLDGDKSPQDIGAKNSSLVVYEKIVNRGDRADVVILPDGSRVTLEPKSRIQYAPALDGPERQVYLDGKAFFEVVRDEKRPFIVLTHEVITKVLGTSFMVTAYRREKEVTVSVRTGKVSVYPKTVQMDSSTVEPVILTPNQEFRYNKDQDKGARRIVPEPEALLPEEEVKRMRFEDASPKVIFEAIETVYGVDIVYDEGKFSSCKVTTTISDGNIFNRLRIICEVVNASYRLDENRIIIEGDGCQSSYSRSDQFPK